MSTSTLGKIPTGPALLAAAVDFAADARRGVSRSGASLLSGLVLEFAADRCEARALAAQAILRSDLAIHDDETHGLVVLGAHADLVVRDGRADRLTAVFGTVVAEEALALADLGVAGESFPAWKERVRRAACSAIYHSSTRVPQAFVALLVEEMHDFVDSRPPQMSDPREVRRAAHDRATRLMVKTRYAMDILAEADARTFRALRPCGVAVSRAFEPFHAESEARRLSGIYG